MWSTFASTYDARRGVLGLRAGPGGNFPASWLVSRPHEGPGRRMDWRAPRGAQRLGPRKCRERLLGDACPHGRLGRICGAHPRRQFRQRRIDRGRRSLLAAASGVRRALPGAQQFDAGRRRRRDPRAGTIGRRGASRPTAAAPGRPRIGRDTRRRALFSEGSPAVSHPRRARRSRDPTESAAAADRLPRSRANGREGRRRS